jgi:hypothetical protein
MEMRLVSQLAAATIAAEILLPLQYQANHTINDQPYSVHASQLLLKT